MTNPETIGRASLVPGGQANPVDIRLVPAAILSIAICSVIPIVEVSLARAIPVLCVGFALISTALVLKFQVRDSPRAVAVSGILSVALWATSASSMSALDQRIAAEESGWLEVVRAQDMVRLEIEVTAPAQERPSQYGPIWFTQAEVLAFESAQAPRVRVEHPGAVMVRGTLAWANSAPGQSYCFFGTPNISASGSVFIRPESPPISGTCAPHSDSTDGPHSETGRDRLRNQLRELSSTTLGAAPELLPGLILGDRTAQTQELGEAMNDAGLSHLSAVSGANCSLIAGAITLFFRSLRVSRSVTLVAVLGTLFLFVHVVGWEPSVIRAGTMGALTAWVLFFGRGRHALPILCLSVLVLLVLMPQLATEAAFQLSVASTAGILIASAPLHHVIERQLNKFLPDVIATLVSASLSVAITAQLAVQPLITTMTGTVNLYAIPANLMAAPLVPFITIPGTFAAFIGPALPWLSQLILWVIGVPAAGIAWIAQWVSSWPHAHIEWPEGSLGVVMNMLHLLGCLALIFLLLKYQPRKIPAQWVWSSDASHLATGGQSQPRVTLPVLSAGVVVLIVAVGQAAVLIPQPARALAKDWVVLACDVGQGDMFMVRTGPQSALVIDTGPEKAEATRCLRRSGVQYIDMLVLTHLHSDHIGGVAAVTEHSQPQATLYSTVEDNPLPLSQDIPRNAIRAERGMQGILGMVEPKSSEELLVEWQILEADSHASHENNASVVLLVKITSQHDSLTALFTGDLEEDGARGLIHSGLLPDGVDVLKLGHHGARNGGTDIIRTLNPSIGLVGVGEDNSYGHPAREIVDAVEEQGQLLRTDVHGTSTLSLSDREVVAHTSG